MSLSFSKSVWRQESLWRRSLKSFQPRSSREAPNKSKIANIFWWNFFLSLLLCYINNNHRVIFTRADFARKKIPAEFQIKLDVDFAKFSVKRGTSFVSDRKTSDAAIYLVSRFYCRIFSKESSSMVRACRVLSLWCLSKWLMETKFDSSWIRKKIDLKCFTKYGRASMIEE